MNRAEIKAYLLTKDPKLKKNFWNGSGEDYTVWAEHHPRTIMSDDGEEEQIYTVTISRYTKNEKDKLAGEMLAFFMSESVPTEELIIDHDPESGYWHFIVECYVTK